MTPDANDAVKDPRSSSNPLYGVRASGPRTEEGKSRSSRNSLKFGLFTAHDFIRDGEEEDYAGTLTSLMSDLAPEGTLEETFATEIMGATWRLRRCRLVEEAFGFVENLDFDPMIDERTEKQQKSVDRARAQSHLILRRSLAELRKLQKGRTIQEQLQDQKPAPKSTSTPSAGFPNMEALMAMADHQLAQRYRDSGLSSFCNPVAPAAAPPAGSFCNPAPKPQPPAATPKTMPRNAPCGCGSGVKYKRCCGKDAAPVLSRAA